MASREKAIKCGGKRCKEVFHIYENYEPGGINDSGYIAVKCKKCGEITKIRMKNPSKYGCFDNFDIIDVWEDGDESQYDSLPDGEAAIVMGNEPAEGLPTDFRPHIHYPFWQDKDLNLEITAEECFEKFNAQVDKELKCLYNGWVKSMPGYDDVERCIVTIEYECGVKVYEATWGKELKNDQTFCCKNFQLIEHTGNDKYIDGVYSRDEMMNYLLRCLTRWKLIANQVVVVTPFIGFDFPFSKDKDRAELIGLWELLNSTLDIDKTTFITRVSTYGSLKKCQKMLEVPSNVLREWDLMNNLQKMVDNPKTRVKTRAQFHAKFYAGVFDDHVEMLSGSFNVQTGVILEQMHLREISRELFKTNYLDWLVEGFEYEPSYNPRTLFVNISKDGKVRSEVKYLNRMSLDGKGKSCEIIIENNRLSYIEAFYNGEIQDKDW